MNDIKEQRFRCVWEPEPGIQVYAPVEDVSEEDDE